jgi:hypothetical protein
MLGRASSGCSRLARTVQIKIIVDAGDSEQSDRLPDERRPRASSNAVVHTDTNDAHGIDVAS